MRKMRKLHFVILLLVVCLGRTSTAAEQQDPKKMFEAATAEFNLGHYPKAAAMYEEIYKVTLEPVLLYNIAQAYRLGGDLDKALFFYKGYARAQPQARNRVEVQRRIAELEQTIEAKRRTQERPPNTTATVEPRNRPQAATPSPETPRASEAPAPTTTSEAPPATAPAPAETPTAAASNETPPPSSERPIWKKWWFWTIIGGVVVAGVVIGVAVAATSTPTFSANLPESGPAARALMATPSSTRAASTLRIVEVQF
jgi:hypothetical protein